MWGRCVCRYVCVDVRVCIGVRGVCKVWGVVCVWVGRGVLVKLKYNFNFYHRDRLKCQIY